MVRDGDGKYAEILDPRRKSRTDHSIPPRSDLYATLLARLRKRVFLPMRRYFQFEVRGVERLLLARYAAEDAGHFAMHRDHMGDDYHREFGLTINLNADFSGGELAFPEFDEAHKPAPGSAVVYSGTLMHIVRPVSSGARFCLLSFLMGERGLAVLERYEAAHGHEFERRTIAAADGSLAVG
jgi:predicted 2-oxoglutarate/Fe(II)-dependent dioxygenase YbiX